MAMPCIKPYLLLGVGCLEGALQLCSPGCLLVQLLLQLYYPLVGSDSDGLCVRLVGEERVHSKQEDGSLMQKCERSGHAAAAMVHDIHSKLTLSDNQRKLVFWQVRGDAP
jgi:hypothetical protein